MKEYKIKFKKIKENEIIIKADNKQEVMDRINELFNKSKYKDLDISNHTKHYYVVELNDKEVMKKSN